MKTIWKHRKLYIYIYIYIYIWSSLVVQLKFGWVKVSFNILCTNFQSSFIACPITMFIVHIGIYAMTLNVIVESLAGGGELGWKSILAHINEYWKFANSLELGSWILVANVGKTRAITNHYQSIVEDWNLAIEEFHGARISQCLCPELFEISVFTNVGRVS